MAELTAECRLLLDSALARRRAGGRAPVTVVTSTALLVLATLAFFGIAQRGTETCCVVTGRLGWAATLARTPGSVVAPAQSLPVWGALLQVLLLLGAAEVLFGSRLVLAVGLAAQVATTGAARVLFWAAGPSPPGLGGMSPTDRDTGPSAVVVALAAFVLCRLRLRRLLVLLGLGLLVEVLLVPNLAGAEHLVAAVVGWAAGARRSGEGAPAGVAPAPGQVRLPRPPRWASSAVVGALACLLAADGVAMAVAAPQLVRGGDDDARVVYVAVLVDPGTAGSPAVTAAAAHADASPAVELRTAARPAGALLPYLPADRLAGLLRHPGRPARPRTAAERAGDGHPGGCAAVLTTGRPPTAALLSGRHRHLRFLQAEPVDDQDPASVARPGGLVLLDVRARPAADALRALGRLTAVLRSRGLAPVPAAALAGGC